MHLNSKNRLQFEIEKGQGMLSQQRKNTVAAANTYECTDQFYKLIFEV